jgi:hypothetical protein
MVPSEPSEPSRTPGGFRRKLRLFADNWLAIYYVSTALSYSLSHFLVFSFLFLSHITNYSKRNNVLSSKLCTQTLLLLMFNASGLF